MLVVKVRPGDLSRPVPCVLGMNVIHKCYRDFLGSVAKLCLMSPKYLRHQSPLSMPCESAGKLLGATMLFEPPDTGLPAGLLASRRGIAYIHWYYRLHGCVTLFLHRCRHHGYY